MKNETRRKLLKGLAVMPPAAWTHPVVGSVVRFSSTQLSGPLILIKK